jgi:hypothetical protein
MGSASGGNTLAGFGLVWPESIKLRNCTNVTPSHDHRLVPEHRRLNPDVQAGPIVGSLFLPADAGRISKVVKVATCRHFRGCRSFVMAMSFVGARPYASPLTSVSRLGVSQLAVGAYRLSALFSGVPNPVS